MSGIIDPQVVAQITELINQSNRIAIISHRSADPDTIGANLCLRILLNRLGKTAESYCIDPIMPYYLNLPNASLFRTNFLPENHDLIITVDSANLPQTYYLQHSPSDLPIINIDHHSSNHLFGTINLVSDRHSSTCELLFDLIHYSWQFPINPDMATLLLAGIHHDTGSFKHSSTTADVLEKAGILIEKGACQTTIDNCLYRTLYPTKMRIWSKALSKFTTCDDGKGISVLTNEDFQEAKADPADLSGISFYLAHNVESNYILLLSNQANKIRGSLRTNQPLNLIPIAEQFGGGGHRQACGFSLPGSLVEREVWKIV